MPNHQTIDEQRCTKCGGVKAAHLFGREKRKTSGLKSACKECEKLASRKWRQGNPEASVQQAYTWKALNPEKHAEISKKATKKWRSKNTDLYQATRNRWLKEHPGYFCQYRERRGNAPERAPWCTWTEILRIYDQGKRLSRHTGEEIHIDHIFPLVSQHVSGLNCPANLRPVPARVNRAKHNKLPGFLAEQLWVTDESEVFYE